MAKYDSTGSGAKPKLGSCASCTPARPGVRNPSAPRGDSPKAARPGYAQGTKSGPTSSNKVARPGGAQGISK